MYVRNQSQRKQRGDGLLEVLLAIIVLGIGMWSLQGFLRTSSKATKQTYSRQEMVSVAESIAQDQARKRLAERKSGVVDVTPTGLVFDAQTPPADSIRLRYLAEVTPQGENTVVSVMLYRPTDPPGTYTAAVASY